MRTDFDSRSGGKSSKPWNFSAAVLPNLGQCARAALVALALPAPSFALSAAVDSNAVPAKAAAAAAAPRTFLLDGRALAETRRRAQAGDPALAEPLKELRKEAAKRMRAKLWAITEKAHLAPGGDPHDYVSLATYYWPNPATSNGLPYVRRDGEKTPENDEYDGPRLNGMLNAVHQLALAYYLCGDEACGARAARQLEVWFLDEATRMNPNLNHAQLAKGLNEGGAIGIIDARELSRLPDDLALLRGVPGWTADDQRRLQQWFRDYLGWLTTSPLGKKEGAGTNNHGNWYDVQAASIALFLGDEARAREILERVKTGRIATQIEPDGTQPRELARTRSLSYTLFNLQALFRLARLGEVVGVDLWNYRTADGRGLRAALDWTVPYAVGDKSWDRKQITAVSHAEIALLLRQAARAYRAPEYERKLAALPDAADAMKRLALEYPPEKP